MTNLRPVLRRELMVRARRAGTYWFRLAGPIASILLIILMAPATLIDPSRWPELFRSMHQIIMAMIWIFGPLFAADCLSQEKREGTLGLLLLTPLKPWEIVVAKYFSILLSALGLLLAMGPLMVLPMLEGGVGLEQILFSWVYLACSLIMALGAGVLASAFTQGKGRAMVLALVFGVPALEMTCILAGYSMEMMLGGGLEVALQGRGCSGTVGSKGWFLMMDWGVWQELLTIQQSRLSDLFLFCGVGLVLPAVLMIWFAAVCFAAWWLKRAGRDRPPSRFYLWFDDFFCKPSIAVDFYHRWLKRSLSENPIGWLERRRWTGRLYMWFSLLFSGFCVFICFIARMPEDFEGSWGISCCCLALMAVGLMIIGAGSFGPERANGVMELLVISPLNEHRIILGRLCGLYAQGIPGLSLILLALAFNCRIFWQDVNEFHHFRIYRDNLIAGGIIFCYWLALPITGLYCSLRFRHILSSVVASSVVGFIMPIGLCGWLIWMFDKFELLDDWEKWWFWPIIFIAWIISTNAWFYRALHQRLARRTFVLKT